MGDLENLKRLPKTLLINMKHGFVACLRFSLKLVYVLSRIDGLAHLEDIRETDALRSRDCSLQKLSTDHLDINIRTDLRYTQGPADLAKRTVF